jgi:hypothetical protein
MHTKRRNNMNGGGNGGQHRHNNNRPRRFTNNRPQNGGGDDAASVARTRRNATQNREKYQMMARDALSIGDRVLAENYLQHADHYHRVILALPPEEIVRPAPQYLDPQDPRAGGGANNHQPQQPDENAQHHSQQADNNETQTATHELPSFITQPVQSEGE